MMLIEKAFVHCAFALSCFEKMDILILSLRVYLVLFILIIRFVFRKRSLATGVVLWTIFKQVLCSFIAKLLSVHD